MRHKNPGWSAGAYGLDQFMTEDQTGFSLLFSHVVLLSQES
jgi:hypothetical protein